MTRGLSLVVLAAMMLSVALALGSCQASGAISGTPTSSGTATSNQVSVSADAAEAPENAGSTEPDLSPYEPALREYQDALTGARKPDERIANVAMGGARSRIGGLPVYAFVDLAGDGEPELLIALKYQSGGNGTGTSGSAASYRIYDVYGIEGREAVRLSFVQPTVYDEEVAKYEDSFASGKFGQMPLCYVCEGNAICVNNSQWVETDQPMYWTDVGYWKLQERSTTCKPIDLVFKGGASQGLCHADESGSEEPISDEEANAIYAGYVPNESIEWLEIEGFGGMPAEESQEQAETIETPAYTITIPDEWKDDYSYEFEVEEPPAGNVELGFAWHVKVRLGSGESFHVAMLTDNWGLQGMMRYEKLGQPSAYPGWSVYVYAFIEENGLGDYPSWVRVASGSSSPGITTVAGSTSGDYVLADSDSVVYSKSDLERLSDYELFIARNEVYARHGRIFQNEALKSYFGSKGWYHGTMQPAEFSESLLNETERSNVNSMLEIEKSRNSRYLT